MITSKRAYRDRLQRQQEANERMEGLVTLQKMEQLMVTAWDLTKELKEEGFEKNEIERYLIKKVKSAVSVA
jgi:hypothetical protein